MSIASNLRDEINPLIQKGAICVVDDAGSLYGLISTRFPIGINRIKWSRVPDHVFQKVPANVSDETVKEHVRNFTNECFQKCGILDSNLEVLWLGDRMDYGLKMKFATFVDNCALLFSYPQHAYVIPEDAAWCLNYTFEDEIFFGKSSQKQRNHSVHR